MSQIARKEVSYERVLFFCDAVVAIAITLLALDLKLEMPEYHHLTFADLLSPWRNYVAFLLSFINIAGFWRTHHQMYGHIGKMNESTVKMNIVWLFFIVTLPFSTSVLSTHFGEAPAVFLYSLNIFLLSVVQNFIWDSSEAKEKFVDSEKTTDEERRRFRVMFNLDMINGLISVVLSFFYPTVAFVFLFFKIPIIVMATIYLAQMKKKNSAVDKKERKDDDSK